MSENDRRQGIEFGAFSETMSSLEYPINTDELLAEHGDAELKLASESTTLSAVLDPLQDSDQTFHDEEELETMIMNMVGDDAIGRKNYSDRDPAAISEERDDEGAPGQEVEDQDSF